METILLPCPKCGFEMMATGSATIRRNFHTVVREWYLCECGYEEIVDIDSDEDNLVFNSIPGL